MKKIVIHTDGGCRGNPGVGGWGVVIEYVDKSQKKVKKEVNSQVLQGIGPIALIKEVFIVRDLPKTRSGKIMRRILKRLFTGEALGDLSTLANPESVEVIKETIKK